MKPLKPFSLPYHTTRATSMEMAISRSIQISRCKHASPPSVRPEVVLSYSNRLSYGTFTCVLPWPMLRKNRSHSSPIPGKRYELAWLGEELYGGEISGIATATYEGGPKRRTHLAGLFDTSVMRAHCTLIRIEDPIPRIHLSTTASGEWWVGKQRWMMARVYLFLQFTAATFVQSSIST